MTNKKLSIIIPNFNGLKNLKKNLPAVLALKSKFISEIIIVDDASTDGSVEFIRQLTSLKKNSQLVNSLINNKITIKLIKNKKNLGFGPAVNKGVRSASGEIVVLLNTDVLPEKNIFQHVLPYFKKKDTFAVGFLEKTKVNGKIELHGRGKGKLEKGFFLHQKYPDYQTSGFSLWASGGSSAFDRKKWLKLKGFDEIFAPFYWEDVDLGFRAWLKGYKVYFEPKAIVWHYHQKGSIKIHYSKDFIKTISWRNQFLFFWKYFFWGKYLMWHLFWLPYHFVSFFFKGEVSFFKGFLLALRDFKKLKKVKPKINKIEAIDIFNPK